LALRSDGTVVGWGWNRYGQASGATSAGADSAAGAVILDGHVLSNIKAIAASGNYSLALDSSGMLVGWGADDRGRPLNPPEGLSNVIAIAAGWNHGLALKQDGTVESWGRANKPPGLSNIVAIAAGGAESSIDLAVQSGGTVVSWALRGADRDVAVPSGLSNVVAVAAGWGHSLALKTDGTVFGWGANSYGQATGTPITNSSYRAEGPVILQGRAISNVVAIAAGAHHSLALAQDGTVTEWGDRHMPAVPFGLTGAVAIAAGVNFAAAVTTNTAAWPANK